MKQLSRFEANLLRIVHGIFQRAPLEKVLPLVTARVPRPPCLCRHAVDLLQDTMAKGTVSLLAREGWRRERFVRGTTVADGRLWQRTQPADLGLTFSQHALGFLIWLTAWTPEETEFPAGPPAEDLTTADRVLFFLTFRLLRGTEVGQALRRADFIASDGLCQLVFPDDFKKPPGTLSWKFWMASPGSSILECLQRELTQRWVEIELAKERITDSARMLALGKIQDKTLQSFLAAANDAGRWDLARFLLQALAILLAGNRTATHWHAALNVKSMRLAERTEAYRASLVVLRQLETLQKWDAQARTVGYFDEGYAASQLWKADWEKYEGEELCRRAQAILREVEPLKS
jgi:FtsH ternary system domain X6